MTMACVLNLGPAEVELFLPGPIVAARKCVLVEQSYDLHSFGLSSACHLQDVKVLLYHHETRERRRGKQ